MLAGAVADGGARRATGLVSRCHTSSPCGLVGCRRRASGCTKARASRPPRRRDRGSGAALWGRRARRPYQSSGSRSRGRALRAQSDDLAAKNRGAALELYGLQSQLGQVQARLARLQRAEAQDGRAARDPRAQRASPTRSASSTRPRPGSGARLRELYVQGEPDLIDDPPRRRVARRGALDDRQPRPFASRTCRSSRQVREARAAASQTRAAAWPRRPQRLRAADRRGGASRGRAALAARRAPRRLPAPRSRAQAEAEPGRARRLAAHRGHGRGEDRQARRRRRGAPERPEPSPSARLARHADDGLRRPATRCPGRPRRASRSAGASSRSTRA